MFHVIQDRENLEKALRKATDSDDGSKLLFVQFLWAHDRNDEAESILGEVDDTLVDPLEMKTLLLADRKETWNQARDLLLQALEDAPNPKWVGLLYQTGFPKDALEQAKRLLADGTFPESERARLMFYAEEQDAETYLGFATSRKTTLIARLYIAQKCLGCRERAAAVENLEHSSWGRANSLLGKLKINPLWPHWVESKAEAGSGGGYTSLPEAHCIGPR